MEQKLQMTIAMSVKGMEGLNLTLNYEDTTLKTVVAVQKEVLGAFLRLLENQKV